MHGTVYPIGPEDAESLIGLPNDGSACDDIDDVNTFDEIKKKYKLGEGQIPVAVLHQILANKEANEVDFKVLFTMIFMGTILSPTSSMYIRRKDLNRAQNANSIRGK